jgi:uncharacterized membrane protein YheB (UPF0754 family)
MKILIKTGQWIFRYTVPPLVIALGVLKDQWAGAPAWTSDVYTLLLASLVGYFTNFIAIKMLFRPKQKTIFGRQGLIPRNQDRIAETLGESIAENFFSPGDIITYVEKNRLAHKGLDGLMDLIRNRLRDPAVRSDLTRWLARRIKSHGPGLQSVLADLSEIYLTRLLTQQLDLKKMVITLTRFTEKHIENGTLDLNKLTDTLAGQIHDRVPALARLLSESIQEYIDSQGILKKGTLKFARLVAQLDEHRIRYLLYRNISSPVFRRQVYEILVRAVGQFSAYLHTDTGLEQVDRLLQRSMALIRELVQEKGIPGLIRHTEVYLRQESAWETLGTLFEKAAAFLHQEMDDWIRSTAFRSHLEKALGWTLKQVDVSVMVKEKIRAFNLLELERLILSVSGEELGTIEVLGGVLGAITGLALFNLKWFFYFLGGLLGAAGLEYILTRFFKSRK